VTLHDGAGIRLVAWARNGANGLLTTPGDEVAATTSSAARAHRDADGDRDSRVRDEEQQYARRERSALAEAIEKELSQGLRRDPGD
jgi:hypothetical protein